MTILNKIKLCSASWSQMADYAESKRCRRVTLLNYFDESFSKALRQLWYLSESTSWTIVRWHRDRTKGLSAVTSSERKIRNRLCYWFFKGSASEKSVMNTAIFHHSKGSEYTKEQWRAYKKIYCSKAISKNNTEFVVLATHWPLHVKFVWRKKSNAPWVHSTKGRKGIPKNIITKNNSELMEAGLLSS